jgi:hypothetical protein
VEKQVHLAEQVRESDVRQRVLQVMRFLGEVAKRRNPIVRDWTEHAWTLDLADVPAHPAIKRAGEVEDAAVMLVATHEAGHAVMHFVEQVPFLFVTIVPRGTSAGSVHHEPVTCASFHEEEDSEVCDARARSHMRIAWGGSVANAIAGQHDHESEERFANDYRDLSDYGSFAIGGEEAVFRQTREETERALRLHWPAVEALARALTVHRTLNEAEARRVIEEHIP